MIENINKAAMWLGVRLAVIPIEALEDVKASLAVLAKENELNSLQQRIINQRYVLDINDRMVKSIVVAAWKMRHNRLVFNYAGKKVSCIVDDSFSGPGVTQRLLIEIFENARFTLEYTHWLPQKHLAVRSGLCTYGRNNLAYCDDWGSFVRIETYVSDIVKKDYPWRDLTSMSLCQTCGKCIAACPTGAIMPDRFLLDNEKCLGLHNKEDDMPAWIASTAHNAIVGCYHCQTVCPANKKRFDTIEEIVFDENETQMLLNSSNFIDLPDNMRKKLWHFDTGREHKFFARNLRLMLDNA